MKNYFWKYSKLDLDSHQRKDMARSKVKEQVAFLDQISKLQWPRPPLPTSLLPCKSLLQVFSRMNTPSISPLTTGQIHLTMDPSPLPPPSQQASTLPSTSHLWMWNRISQVPKRKSLQNRQNWGKGRKALPEDWRNTNQVGRHQRHLNNWMFRPDSTQTHLTWNALRNLICY